MKKFTTLLAGLLCITLAFAEGHAAKPEIMVVPSDLWCNTNGFMTTYDNMGTIEKVPDYKTALQEDANLKLAISTINGLMAERGFPLKVLEQELKHVQQDAAEEMMLTSKNGNSLAESPIDLLRRTAKADIIMELTWTINQQGPKYVLAYTLEGIDPYTSKSIANATGVGTPSFSSDVTTLLYEAVVANIDNFNNTLQDFFNDLFENGREIRVSFNVFDNNEAGIDLESEFGEDEEELIDIIKHWFKKNTVGGRFSNPSASETRATFTQVRIPLLDDEGDAIDAATFIKKLTKKLKKEYQIPAKVDTKGLGEVRVILGEK